MVCLVDAAALYEEVKSVLGLTEPLDGHLGHVGQMRLLGIFPLAVNLNPRFEKVLITQDFSGLLSGKDYETLNRCAPANVTPLCARLSNLTKQHFEP